MIEINLIPDVKQELLKAQRSRALVVSGSIVVSIVAIGVVIALVVYVFAVQSVRSSIADDIIKEKGDELAQVEDLSKILTIQNQLSIIPELNANKSVSSRLFDVLAAVIPPAPNSVALSQATVDVESSTIGLEGQTRAYDSMEVFKKTLGSAIIVYTVDGTEKQVNLASNISTTNISYGEDASGTKVVRFTISFVYSKDLFASTIGSVAIKLSVNGNVTDSYLGLPKSIFTERAKDIGS